MEHDETTQTTQTTRKHEARHRSAGRTNGSRAEYILERLSEPVTYREIAKKELQRATVWVPMLLASGASLLWLNKKIL